MPSSEIPTFRNQTRAKCKLNVAEWVNQLRSCGVEGGVKGQRPCKAYTILILVLYYKILFGEQVLNCSKKFIFHKSTYKSPSYVSTPCTHLSFLISACLTTIVSPVSALFCRMIPFLMTFETRNFSDGCSFVPSSL